MPLHLAIPGPLAKPCCPRSVLTLGFAQIGRDCMTATGELILVLDAGTTSTRAILFAPDGALVPQALRAVRKGGRVVCAGIHMSDIPAFPYDLLWGERRIVSVANLTRRDGDEFLALAPKVPVRTEVTRFALEEANDALDRLRRGALQGAAVLVP